MNKHFNNISGSNNSKILQENVERRVFCLVFQLVHFLLDDQVKYNQMSASTGEVTLDLMDQSFSGELAAPQPSALLNSNESSFGSLIKKKGVVRTTCFYKVH